MKKILTIAGYDPSSGAGITRDLDVFFSLGLHGLSAPTATVIQGPLGVSALHPTPLPQFTSMLDVSRAGIDLSGVKIGVVWDEPYCMEIASFLSERPHIPVVIDPISQAKNDTPLVTGKGFSSLITALFPLAAAVTPNITEASAITGRKIDGPEDMKEAARAILGKGPRAVIIKGGHLEGEPMDLLFDGDDFVFHRKRRVHKTVHGTGCMFSSAIASFLAHGYPLKVAFFATQDFMTSMLNESYRIDDKGYFYSSSGIVAGRRSGRIGVLDSLESAGVQMTRLQMADLVPEGQLNMGYAIMEARGIEDIAAFPGRIGLNEDRIFIKGEPRFGASSRVARMILAFMKFYPFVRSGVNVRFSVEAIDRAREKGMDVVRSDWSERPPQGEDNGESFDFLVEAALKGAKSAPDIIYDTGFAGKEPTIRVFAANPQELIKKMEIMRR
jgi:hydroxymethylpyrimidine kinase / phosphomethylpyrimidine kinase / thiamine-phosphate diphosphorylase